MKSIRVISFVIIALAVSIPGLYWQILDPILGIHTFGTEFVNTPRQMAIKGIPSTLLSWIVTYILYTKLIRFFVSESPKHTERIALIAVLVFLLSNVGFVINWLSVEIISIFYGWTTLEYIDLLGGIVIMYLWGIIPAIASAVIFFGLAMMIFKLGSTRMSK